MQKKHKSERMSCKGQASAPVNPSKGERGASKSERSESEGTGINPQTNANSPIAVN